ncbi:MAG: GUN4 domain-containing protein, partial [Cylindrospermopsis raciborskii KL1]|uniref:GUN4 domain-containing protein n=1 Tax=Cylindrospermopsis raciborskii TaxID=77022 RepID=UPI001A24F4F3
AFLKLNSLLQAQNFKEADKETRKIMLAVANREEEGWLRIEDAEKFPCKELRSIDQLWLKYSRGKFGISVQQQIYQSLGGTKEFNPDVWRSMGDRVGWRSREKWLDYSDFNFSQTAPSGHLPGLFIGGWGGWCGMGVSSLLSRHAECNT